jgi:hypothetical protein
MAEAARNPVLDECVEHNEHLLANGHLVSQVALQRRRRKVSSR